MKVRDATKSDAGAIVAIANHFIRNTTISFNSVEKEAETQAADMAAYQAMGHPYFVAETAGQVVGYATYAQFRKGSGYARTMEHTVMLSPEARGVGTGRLLMGALEAHAAARGMGSLIGGISGENLEAVAFHRTLGFVEVGRVARAGFKFGRWIDLILLQKRLSSEIDTG